jgi:hypothetical protein
VNNEQDSLGGSGLQPVAFDDNDTRPASRSADGNGLVEVESNGEINEKSETELAAETDQSNSGKVVYDNPGDDCDELDSRMDEQINEQKPIEKGKPHEAHTPPMGFTFEAESKSPLQIVSGNKTYDLQKPTKAHWPELYRYEMEFRPFDGGHKVLIRKRLRFTMSEEMGKVRTSRTIVTAKCPQLTAEMVQDIKQHQFSDAAKDALQLGGIGYGIVENLISRPGSGRYAETRQLEEHVKLAVIRLLRQSLSPSRVTSIAAHRRKNARR